MGDLAVFPEGADHRSSPDKPSLHWPGSQKLPVRSDNFDDDREELVRESSFVLRTVRSG